MLITLTTIIIIIIIIESSVHICVIIVGRVVIAILIVARIMKRRAGVEQEHTWEGGGRVIAARAVRRGGKEPT